VVRVLTLQILLHFLSSDVMSLQRHVFNWKPVLWNREKEIERAALRATPQFLACSWEKKVIFAN